MRVHTLVLLPGLVALGCAGGDRKSGDSGDSGETGPESAWLETLVYPEGANLPWNTSFVDLALDADGSAHIAFAETSLEQALYARVDPAGSTTLEIIEDAGRPGKSMAIALHDGVPHVVFDQWDSDFDDGIYHSERSGGAWSAPLQVIDQANSDPSHNALHFGADGELHLLNAGGGGALTHHSRAAAGGWASHGTVDDTWSLFTGATTDGAGRIHVVSLAFLSFTEGVVRHSVREGDSWTTTDIATLAYPSSVPGFDVASDGTVTVAWVDDDAGELWVTDNSGGSFGSPALLAETEEAREGQTIDPRPREPQVVVGDDGQVWVAWVQMTSTFEGELRLAELSAGTTERVASGDWGARYDMERGADGKLQLASYRWSGDVVLLRQP